MVSMKDIRSVGRRIGREFKPRQVILFGSHSRGTANEDSDVDLLIVMPFEGHSVDKSVEILLTIHPPFPTDILVRTPRVVRQRIAMGDCFMQEIIAKGKVLYEAHYR